MVDTLGYGRSGGRPSERGCYGPRRRPGDSSRRERVWFADDVVVFGHSLGSAVAVYLPSTRRCGGWSSRAACVGPGAMAALPFRTSRSPGSAGASSTGRAHRLAVAARCCVRARPRTSSIPFAQARRVFERASRPRSRTAEGAARQRGVAAAGGGASARGVEELLGGPPRLGLRRGAARAGRRRRCRPAAGVRRQAGWDEQSGAQVRETIRELALEVQGFLSAAEGTLPLRLAVESSRRAPCLEIGSYCGRSTLFLAEGLPGRPAGIRSSRSTTIVARPSSSPASPTSTRNFSTSRDGVVTTLDRSSATCGRPDLDRLGHPDRRRLRPPQSLLAGRAVGLVFIDGGHSEADAFQDFHGWSGHVVPGGYLCLHDVFSDPADGGLAPYRVMQYALTTGSVGAGRPGRDAGRPAPAAAGEGAGRVDGPAAAVRSARYLGGVPESADRPLGQVGSGWRPVDRPRRRYAVRALRHVVRRAPGVGRPPASPVPFGPFAAPRHLPGQQRRPVAPPDAARGAGRALRYYTDGEDYPREILPRPRPSANRASASGRSTASCSTIGSFCTTWGSRRSTGARSGDFGRSAPGWPCSIRDRRLRARDQRRRRGASGP